ncbi:MAG TPA: hypothetical protein DDX98_14120 [Bacteroidales bacterium]|jgi:tetratricopeptide (TPR) repeat protein|nr:hypothetical protein [Bacteroidales bacterium]
MRTFYFLLIALFFSINIGAQQNFEEAMQKGLSDMENIQSLEDFVEIANFFERVSVAEPNEWLPAYYSAYVNVILAFKTQDMEEKKAYLGKAEVLIDKAMETNEKESEIHTLKGMYYQAYIGLDPMNYGQLYSGKAAACFNDALEYNPDNPRPIYLQAISVMHTPEQYGGGKQRACPMFNQASEMFTHFKPEKPFYPQWGADQCEQYLQSCTETAQK